MKRLLAILLSAALVAAIAAIALANGGSISDPKGDVKHNPAGADANYDLVKATSGAARHGQVKHTVTVAGRFGNPSAAGPGGSQPTMWIDVPHHSFTGNCDYLIQPVPPGAPGNNSDQTKYVISKCSDNSKTGTARVTRKSADTDKLVFKPSAIGNPSKYGWSFIFITDTNHGFVLVDRAPDKGFKVHRL